MESAREIFDQACAEIAAQLAPFGFQYRRSQHSAVRATGDLKFVIHFQSSPRNYLLASTQGSGLSRVLSKLPGLGDLATFGNVTLIEHASVSSKALRSFRRTVHGAWHTNGAVTGGQIGNLQEPAKWVEFNLANPNTRRAVIDEAKKLIDHVGIPYLERFHEPENVIIGLLEGTMPWMWRPSALEYICCFGTKQKALQLLERLISEPEVRDEYKAAVSHYKAHGTPDVWDSRAACCLAKSAIILGME
jgi:hypothetical protein